MGTGEGGERLRKGTNRERGNTVVLHDARL